MKIQIDLHTLERALERGSDEEEIADVVETGFTVPAKYGREGKAKIYNFNQRRHGKYYEQKRIEVYYILRRDITVTVTVYVFYGKWEVLR